VIAAKYANPQIAASTRMIVARRWRRRCFRPAGATGRVLATASRLSTAAMSAYAICLRDAGFVDYYFGSTPIAEIAR